MTLVSPNGINGLNDQYSGHSNGLILFNYITPTKVTSGSRWLNTIDAQHAWLSGSSLHYPVKYIGFGRHTCLDAIRILLN